MHLIDPVTEANDWEIIRKLSKADTVWKVLYDAPDAVILINKNTLKNEGIRKIVQVKYVTKLEPIEPITFTIKRDSYDCSSRIFRTLSIEFYDKNAKLLSSKEIKAVDQKPKEGSIGETILLKVCGDLPIK